MQLEIPDAIGRLFSDWGFEPTHELPGGHCSRVYADATRVAKVPFQGEEMTSGYRATWLLAERGGPRVLVGDEASGTVLLERILPGTLLSQAGLGEEDCFQLVSQALRRLRGISPQGFPLLSEVFEADHPVVEHLLATQPEVEFLHGDLHHDNMLLGPIGWVTIDPKGVAGDRALEAAGFTRNPCTVLALMPDLAPLLASRAERWARELDVSTDRVIGWTWATVRKDPDESPWGAVRRGLERIWPETLPDYKVNDRTRL